MEEGDHMASGARPRFAVHELVPGRLEPAQRAGEVGDAEREVVQAGPSPFDVACDRRVGRGGLEQLEPSVSVAEEQDPDALAVDLLHRGGLGAQERAEDGGRPVERFDRNADVIQTQHSGYRYL